MTYKELTGPEREAVDYHIGLLKVDLQKNGEEVSPSWLEATRQLLAGDPNSLEQIVRSYEQRPTTLRADYVIEANGSHAERLPQPAAKQSLEL